MNFNFYSYFGPFLLNRQRSSSNENLWPKIYLFPHNLRVHAHKKFIISYFIQFTLRLYLVIQDFPLIPLQCQEVANVLQAIPDYFQLHKSKQSEHCKIQEQYYFSHSKLRLPFLSFLIEIATVSCKFCKIWQNKFSKFPNLVFILYWPDYWCDD